MFTGFANDCILIWLSDRPNGSGIILHDLRQNREGLKTLGLNTSFEESMLLSGPCVSWGTSFELWDTYI